MKIINVSIVLGFVLLLLVAGCIDGSQNQGLQQNEQNNQQQIQTQQQNEQNNQQNSASSTPGKIYKCIYSQKGKGVDITGVVYVSTNNYRTDTEQVIQGEKVKSTVIIKKEGENTVIYSLNTGYPGAEINNECKWIKISSQEAGQEIPQIDTTNAEENLGKEIKYETDGVTYSMKCEEYSGGSDIFNVDGKVCSFEEILKNYNSN